MLIVPWSIPILGCVTLGAWMIFCCRKKQKKQSLFSTMLTSLWLHSLFWFLASALFVPLILTLSHHLRPKTSNLIILCFVKKSLNLTSYFCRQRVNSVVVGWITRCHGRSCSPSTAGRERASAIPLVYLKVKIVFVLTIRTTYLLPWPLRVCLSRKEEAHPFFFFVESEKSFSLLNVQ